MFKENTQKSLASASFRRKVSVTINLPRKTQTNTESVQSLGKKMKEVLVMKKVTRNSNVF